MTAHNTGTLIHETMDTVSWLCLLKRLNIPKPDVIQIGEEEGITFWWYDTSSRDYARAEVKSYGRVHVYFYDNTELEGFHYFYFEAKDAFEL